MKLEQDDWKNQSMSKGNQDIIVFYTYTTLQ